MHKVGYVEKVELMKVEDAFMIERIGLILAPSFEPPPEGKWENISETVSILTPEGIELEADALFSVVHLNIKDPQVSARKRWPVLVSLRGVGKECVPIGSILYVSQATKTELMGKNA